MSMPTRADIAAVVVLYNPDHTVLDNIASYRDQVARVIAVDNTPATMGSDLSAELVAAGIEHMALGENRGIATALNVGCRRAIELGFAFAITFDQDSTAEKNMIETMCICFDAEESRDVAIAAPLLQHVGGRPVETQPTCAELDYAITSGSLIRLAAFRDLKGFREDFFIDEVDHEFCMRARRAGFRILQRRDAVLMHRMGELKVARFIKSFNVTNYSAVRRYYMIRNLFEMKREFGAENPEWLAEEYARLRRDLPKILLGEPDKWNKFKLMYQGWKDQRAGRFGRYEDLHPK